ncbi:hypothetical protein BT63DRAFT_451189 [Microthyrium microscopicum]|uniref:Uncharacterized protein n=1 Tax=Microthyrium microscopicum TaxID=703497 RepID=A0A6A6UP08_9PEZI|nr:hypothetical protein BT63DRAFT_451189 [Microthyrium microscopicum]
MDYIASVRDPNHQTPYTTTNLSFQTSFTMAPERGESPPPETQRPDQLEPPAKNPNQGTTDKAENESNKALDNLESNPTHIMEKHAEEKSSKN